MKSAYEQLMAKANVSINTTNTTDEDISLTARVYARTVGFISERSTDISVLADATPLLWEQAREARRERMALSLLKLIK